MSAWVYFSRAALTVLVTRGLTEEGKMSLPRLPPEPFELLRGEPARAPDAVVRRGAAELGQLLLAQRARRGPAALLHLRPQSGEQPWEGRLDAHGALLHRMGELHQRGVQRLAVELGAGLAVDPVPHQGAAVVGGVDADLVLAAGVEEEAEQGEASGVR